MSLSKLTRQRWLILPLIAAILLCGAPFVPHTVAFQPDPITAAWEKARAAGSYHFTSTLIQKTIPAATVANVGRTSRTEQHYLEGQNDLRNQQMEMTLWTDGGSVLQAESGVAIRVEAGKTFARRGGGDWQEIDSFTDAIAPQGDFLAYLAALRNVTAHPPEMRNGIAFTRYSFHIDGPAFAAYMQTQMEATMRARGELPPGLHLEVSTTFREMTGAGELWVGEDGLPLRQALDLRFPEQQGEWIHAQLTVDFANYGAPQTSFADSLRGGDWQGAWMALPAHLPDLTPLWLLITISALALLFLRYRGLRTVQATVVALMILSQVAGPLLTTFTNVRYFDAQTAKAAADDAQRTENAALRELRSAAVANEFDPHQNPLESGDLEGFTWGDLGGLEMGDTNVQSPQSLQSPLLVDDGVDSDGDGLSDFVEERVGTQPLLADSDGDGLPDNIEVNGFSFGGQTWYTNPNAPDTNGDGLDDLTEWGFNTNAGAPGARRATPLDNDGDGIPDLFDWDNDNDGVPDNKDLAPNIKGDVALTDNAPLQLTVQNLTAGKPVFVDFQLRPQNEQQLWYAFNVLDWPIDGQGQVQDVDGKSYGDLFTPSPTEPNAAANARNGDMKIIPMLEIRMPSSSANLPGQAELTPHNITVGDFTGDGATKVALVPLSVVNDEKSGQRVAFSGRMLYHPSGAWTAAHSVRLAWVVQALVDLPCDPGAEPAMPGCTANGYIYNVPQVIHSYYTDWTLTGLTVREEHGTSMAIAYEDPADDANKNDDPRAHGLSMVIDNHFLTGVDNNNNGQRDIDLSEIVRRFNHTTNGSVSEAQRYAVPNILRVVRQDYPTMDQAVAFTAMTETVKILDVFSPLLAVGQVTAPSLMFAHEGRSRVLSLEGKQANTPHIQFTGSNLVLNMAPTPATALEINTSVGVKWTAYCAPQPVTNPANPGWQPCAPDLYWDELERRYGNLPSLPGDTDPDLVQGRLLATQLYLLGFSAGYSRTVQEGSRIVSGLYSLPSDSFTEAGVRYGIQIGAASVPVIADQVLNTKFSGSALTHRFSKIAAGIKHYFKGGTFSNAQANQTNIGFKAFMKFQAKSLVRSVSAGFGVAGALAMAVLQWATVIPTNTLETNIGLLSASAALIIVFSVVLPVIDVVQQVQAGASALKVLTAFSTAKTVLKVLGVIGTVIAVGVVWGFFIYSMVQNNVTAFSPEFNRAFAEAIAATLFTVFLFLISATVIGGIIAGIVAAIDFLLTIICELGVSELREVDPFYGGACFTLGNTAVKGLTYFLYNFDLMVDSSRPELVVTGPPDLTLADPSKGYVANNALSMRMTVSTTVVHKDPDPNNGLMIYPYLWLFSPENLRSTTFKYSLSRNAPETLNAVRNEMAGAWQAVREDHRFNGTTPMYRGEMVNQLQLPAAISLPAGVNRATNTRLNIGYALPAYECWLVPIPYGPIIIPTPICYARDVPGTSEIPFSALVFDIFPPTLDGFMAQVDAGNGGRKLGWDPLFTTLVDADGDGLRSTAHGGIDPNDGLVDSDGDGLTDVMEMQLRAAGIAVSPLLRDTDGDGLTDWQEIMLGANPALADSDNDGLLDGQEVRHQVVDVNGRLTATWAGGWQVTINAATPFTVWVSSDPLNPDSDGDGISDQAERQLAQHADPAQRRDNQNRPYHPLVANTPPISVFVTVDDIDRYLGPGQSFRYTTTVVANTAVAPGVLNVSAPGVIGGVPNPTALNFNPLTFSGAQTVTQPVNLSVVTNAVTQGIWLTSTANTRLHNASAAGWLFEPVTPEAGLGSFASPTLARGVTVAANRPDRQDSFRLAAKISNAADALGVGDIYSADLLAGTSGLIDNDNNQIMRRGATDPDMACNNAADCLVVWDEAELFGNGIVQGVNYTGFANGFTSDMANPNDTLVRMDFNGDGKDDILYYRRGAATAGVYISNGDGTLTYRALNNGGAPANGFLGDVTADGRDLLIPVNINGDAYDDILFYRPGGGVAGVFITNSNGTVSYLPYRTGGNSVNGFLGDMASPVDTLLPMDINGDGKDDLLYYRPSGGAAGVYVASSSGNGQLTFLPYRDSAGVHNGFAADMANGYDRLVPLDSNGDGFDDIFYSRPGGNYAGVHLANPNGNGQLTYVPYVDGVNPLNGWYPDMSSNYDIAIPLDINGDGKDDIFFARIASGWAGVHLANPQGDGTVTYVPFRNGSTGAHTNGWAADMLNFEDRIVPMDQNGDGKDDLLFYRRGGGFAGIHLANPQGDGSVTYVEYRSPSGYFNGFGGDVASIADDAVPIDLNGDGRKDFLWIRPGGGYASAYLAVPNTPVYRIGGALVGPNGAVKGRLTFPRRNPAPLAHPALDRHPQVASNGNGFLVSYETVAPSLNNVHHIVLEGFDQNGNAVGNLVFNVGDVPRLDDRSLDNDLTWMGDRYRLVTKGRSLANIFIRDFSPTATALNNFTQVASDGLVATAASKIDTTPNLAWDPTTGRWTLTYIRGANDAPNNVQINRYPSVASTTADANTSFLSAYERVAMAWHPQSRGWLFHGQLTDNRQVFGALAANLQGLTGDLATSTRISWTAADIPGHALACPLVSSLPVLDLRFEELPGATAFVDSSGFGRNAVCGSPTQCPTPAVTGAPNAPLSDFGLSFNGNQYLRVPNSTAFQYPTGQSFTWMTWVKTATSSPILRKGIGGANDLMLSIHSDGRLRMGFGNVTSNTLTAGPDLRDNQWHHVAVTLHRATNTATIYTDGVARGSGTFTGSFVTVDDLFIGSGNTGGYIGQLDHLQFYNVALEAATVNAIYNRTQQSYCVATSASSTGNNIQWARLRVTQPDPRGGAISAASGIRLTIDSDLPTASVTSVANGALLGPDQVIGGTASDATSGVSVVQVRVNNGAWQTTNGANTWQFSLAGYSGAVSVQARAIDLASNVGAPSTAVNLTVDNTRPVLTFAAPSNTVKPSKNANGHWHVTLNGTATDTGSGIKAGSLRVQLQQQSGVGVAQTPQTAVQTGNNWSLTYVLDGALFDPTGAYTVTVSAADNVGNVATPATGVVRLDATGPVASLSSLDSAREVITQTLSIGGVVSDTDSIAGIDKVEIAFTPVEQIAALPPGLTGEQAEAQLNRTWTPVTLAGRGAGVATTTWSFAIPTGLENIYQIDLRGTDMLGNVSISSGLWRGVIDTTDPRVVMTATATGVTHLNAQGQRRYQIRFVCGAQDRNLNEASFTCPGRALAQPSRSFEDNTALQSLFPDLALRTGLALSYTLWSETATVAATAGACDSFGRCAATDAAVTAAANPVNEPTAVIVAPAAGSVVAADGSTLNVTLAAESAGLLKAVVLLLDNVEVGVIDFAQAEGLTQAQRTLTIPLPAQGQHTLTARASDWAGATQATLYPVQFTLDTQPPTVTLDTLVVREAETWALGSGILRFGGDAADDSGLAAVQVKVGNGPFIDASFANGQWQIAYPVPDPEGQNLTVLVRAIDQAGRYSEVSQTVQVNLSTANPPDTAISVTPPNPSSGPTAAFSFTGVAGSRSVVAFECKLDNGLYELCASPLTLTDLSKGEHTFGVRAIDAAGYVDPTPATYSWTVNPGVLDVTLSDAPANPTTSRATTFAFSGSGATSFECALDGAGFTACASPQTYSALLDGEHTFLVRGRNGEQVGLATRHVWTVVNAAPVAQNQAVETGSNGVAAIALVAHDEDALTYQIVTPPAFGLLTGLAPNLSYQADTGFSGADSFTFRATDGQIESNVATVTINVTAAPDQTAPITTITLDPATPGGQNGWHRAPVLVRVSAIDGGASPSGVAETRCVLNPVNAPASFDELPAECGYLDDGTEVATDGVYALYAASRDQNDNRETPVSQDFQLDGTPPLVTVTGVSEGGVYPVEAAPTAGCATQDALSGVATAATVSVSGGNGDGTGDFVATCAGAVDQAGNETQAVSVSYRVTGTPTAVYLSVVLLGHEGVKLNQKVTVHSGAVVANTASAGPFLDSGVELSIGQQSNFLGESSVYADSVKVNQKSTIPAVHYNQLQEGQQVSIGQRVTPLALPVVELPPFPSVSPNGNNITVAQNGSLTLAAGSYGMLKVNQKATIIFSGGEYHFAAWDVGQQVNLFFQAPSDIRIAGRLTIGQKSVVGPHPSAAGLNARDIVLYVAGPNGGNGSLSGSPKAAEFGQETALQANVYAPNGTVLVNQKSTVRGALLARWVDIGQEVTLTFDSAFVTPRTVTGSSLFSTPPQGEADWSDEEERPEEEQGLTLQTFLPLVAR